MSNAILTTKDEVNIFLTDIKQELSSNCNALTISYKDGENKQFLITNGISLDDVKKIILKLDISTFVEKMKSEHQYNKNDLYLFGPYSSLVDIHGNKLNLQLYLKLVYLKEQHKVLVVSIHFPKWKLNYQFEGS